MSFIGLEDLQVKMLQYEVISERARLKLTRLLRTAAQDDDKNIEIIRQNKLINLARNVRGETIYVLNGDDWGNYHPAEHAWHNGEMELIMRRPNTADLVETLADILQDDNYLMNDINEILEEDNASLYFAAESLGNLVVVVPSVEEIVDTQDEKEHPNIRLLVRRMENALEQKDSSGVLHASASIFETLAKSVVGIAGVQNQTLKSFFQRYRKDSKLAEPILDYILEIYDRRNEEPLAGHGSLSAPTLAPEDAVVLVEMTKTIVRIERKLAITQLLQPEITTSRPVKKR